ncbi:hypothetical protein K466DRAFT_579451, partial [Polyporus arcularius HHB13444]
MYVARRLCLPRLCPGYVIPAHTPVALAEVQLALALAVSLPLVRRVASVDAAAHGLCTAPPLLSRCPRSRFAAL